MDLERILQAVLKGLVTILDGKLYRFDRVIRGQALVGGHSVVKSSPAPATRRPAHRRSLAGVGGQDGSVWTPDTDGLR